MPVSVANRTKCFESEKLRHESIKQKFGLESKRGIKGVDQGAGPTGNDNGFIKDEQLYHDPVPFVPYPHRSKKVTPWGFIRDSPNLPQRVLSNLINQTESVVEFEKTIEHFDSVENLSTHFKTEDKDPTVKMRVPGSPIAPQPKKTLQAKLYNYTYRPRREKTKTIQLEKQRAQELQKGVSGSPKNSSDRYVNKIFDGRRLKNKNQDGCIPPTDLAGIRHHMMKVGVPSQSGLNARKESNYQPVVIKNYNDLHLASN